MLKSIKVKDYMTQNIITLVCDMDIYEAIAILNEHKISGAPVLDNNGCVVGILSEGDCLKGIIKNIYYDEAGGRVIDFMSSPVETIPSTNNILDVAVAFNEKRIRHFPVVDEGKLVGQISQHDILRAVMDIAQHPSNN